eukprot:5403706-Pleurochrysis_carterae.AAC.2
MEEGIRHGELTPRKEGFVPVEDNELLLHSIHCATQVLCLDHVRPCSPGGVHAEHVIRRAHASA